jgi:predicted ferric reductase
MERSRVNDLYHIITWETARIAGLLAFTLLSASVCLGLLLSLKVRSRSWPRFVTDGLHRHLTLIALVFTAVHTLAVWLDPFTAFLPAEVFVPFATHYRPLWIGLGIVASYLLVAVWASEWIRPRIGYQWWRRLHYASFALFVLATLHGIGSGSDTATWWGMAIYGVGIGSVGVLVAWRMWVAVRPPNRAPSIALLAAAAFALALWTASPAQSTSGQLGTEQRFEDDGGDDRHDDEHHGDEHGGDHDDARASDDHDEARDG